ncbi:hypothetical protein TNCV_1959081 [Trichonephila clavipes]|nr:hypothetical protein TNCV_1959081 [Trichonephila clavipes]
MQLNGLRFVNHYTTVDGDVIHDFQGVDKRRHSFSLKGSSSLHPNSSNPNLCINIFVQVIIGSRRPKGSKILAIVDKTILLVNEVGLCCSILNRKQSNLGLQIIPSTLISSDSKKAYSCRFEVISGKFPHHL